MKITINELHAVTYDLNTGNIVSVEKTKTLSKLQALLNELEITDRNIYLRALRLIKNGKTLVQALTEVTSDK